ncbi:MAG TPA: hypothetical protein PKH47_11875, partial [Anaerolineales bacterium]|nr:hypothetical protein [Anaerolineales bacterium]
ADNKNLQFTLRNVILSRARLPRYSCGVLFAAKNLVDNLRDPSLSLRVTCVMDEIVQSAFVRIS